VGTEPSLLHVPSRSDHDARVHGQFCITRAAFRDKGHAIRYWDSLSVYVVGDGNGNVTWRASLVVLVYSCSSGNWSNNAPTGQAWRGIDDLPQFFLYNRRPAALKRQFFPASNRKCVCSCLLWTKIVSYPTNKSNEINRICI